MDACWLIVAIGALCQPPTAAEPRPADCVRTTNAVLELLLDPAEQSFLARGQQPETEADSDVEPTPRRRMGRGPDFDNPYWREIVPQNDLFHRRQWSMSFLAGCTVAHLGPDTSIPFRFVPLLTRINCVWNSPHPQRRILRGSFEGVFEIDSMPVVEGAANIVVGGSLFLRYNFLTFQDRRWVPYWQMGGGGMYTDAYLHRSRLMGTGFNFIIQWGAGLNISLNPRWSLNTEAVYYHFSNSGIASPNLGVNQIATMLGLTYYFGRRDVR